MECNKDEAIKAMKIAENKLTSDDFEGARRFALKAKKLFPELDNISQLLAVCEVHCSAQKRRNGPEMDLYGILQVECLADELTIKKQYRNLALMLHPDKNSFPGAEAAFKLIGDANMILSDKVKRSLHDLNHQKQTKSDRIDRPSFWTSCPFCNIKCEYYREYLNKFLVCPNCSRQYIASELGAIQRMQNTNQGSKTGQSASYQQKEIQRQENAKDDAHDAKSEENGNVKTEGQEEKVAFKGRCRNSSVASNSNSGRVERHTRSHKRPQVSSCEDAGNGFSPKKRCKRTKLSSDVEDGLNQQVSNTDSKDDLEPGYNTCQDVEFSDFEKDKEKHCFAVDQIWACYDSVDSMPRFYAHIRKVYSRGFRLRVTWLEADPEKDLESTWAEEGLPIACGKFVHGDTVQTSDRLMFSHQMEFEKGSTRFSYTIYPKKGEIWALFKDWDIKWISDPKKHMKYKFDIVEVLSEFDNSNGVLVAYMVKVQGFVSVFQKTSQARLPEQQIPSDELFRFSHRIPSMKLTGMERAGVPVGSCELDTASLPDDLDLYHISNKVNEKNESDYAQVCENDVITSSNSFTKPPKCSSPSQSEEAKLTIHDFNVAKQNSEFQVGQIWALQRSSNGNLPCYAQIKKIEASPLRLHVDALESCTSLYDDMNRPVSCGLFKASTDGRRIFLPDSFLYPVKVETNGRNFGIYPREKEIWVLHIKQDSKCSFSDLDTGECNIVEVLEDTGVMFKVLCLSRVPGYKSVFRAGEMTNMKAGLLEIKFDEIGRFISRIHAFRFTEEKYGDLRGSWELDLAEFPGLLSYIIYPKKGEIWALFKDWDINWIADPQKRTKFNFDIVEVLSDFDNSNGVLVAYMVKVQGFVSVFQRTTQAQLAQQRIPSKELFRFSHRIPSMKLTGAERAGVPVGSCELDTASLPDDLDAFHISNKVNEKNESDSDQVCDDCVIISSTSFTKTPEYSSSSQGKEAKLSIHDFNADKQNWEFQVGQIWAIHKRNEGNLLCYAQIKEIEASPLKLHVDALESCTSLYNDMNRPVSCGLFKPCSGGRQVLLVDSFLYPVKAEVNGKNKFNIYPREKEIWVLHNKQDSDCSFSDLDAGECNIVQVLEDKGDVLKVLSLSRVPGYNSVFRAVDMNAGVLEIQVDEIERFVSQVCAFHFTEEKYGDLRGSWELDLAEFPGLMSS